jgi:hypothetical protein
MQNLKLYEEFSHPKEEDLALEIAEFFDAVDIFKRKRYGQKFKAKLGKNYTPEKIISLIGSLKEKNYEIELYPNMDERALRALISASNIDYSNPIENLEYGLTIIIVSNFMRYKSCINIHNGIVSYDVLNKSSMQEIALNEFNENNIEMLFWNGKNMVTGKFEQTEIFREDGMTTLIFESYETSDGEEYVMSVSATGSFNAGYDLEDIEDIDFL